MSNLIVAVGGTGQLALQYYLQQYLLGVLRTDAQPFQAYVVDTASFEPGVAAAETLFERLQFGHEPGKALGAVVPDVELVRVGPQDHAGTARQLLVGAQASGSDDGPSHPANAFFSGDALGMDVMNGLYARPALSSAIGHTALARRLPSPRTGTRAVVVGSMIGGTGGGLIAPVVDALASNGQAVGQPASLRAVLFAEYFQPDDDTLGASALPRFQSNRTLVLRSLKDGRTPLHSYYVAGGPGTMLGRPLTADSTDHLPWPEAGHPVWRATRALDRLLNDQAIAQAPFSDAEIADLPDDELRAHHADAKQQLRVRLARARAFVHRRVVLRTLSEPFATRIWGRPLLRFLEAYGDASELALGEARRDEFPTQLQAELERALDKLEPLFPAQTGRAPRVAPEAIRKVRWPDPEGVAPHPPLFRGETSAAERAAAALLYWLLRG